MFVSCILEKLINHIKEIISWKQQGVFGIVRINEDFPSLNPKQVFSQNLFIPNSLIKVNRGGCSLTVEYETVALGTRVRLPSSTLIKMR